LFLIIEKHYFCSVVFVSTKFNVKQMSEKIKILYVDDEENNLFSFKATFRLRYDVLTAISAAEAISLMNQHPDLAIIITDQRMPEMTGVEFLESIIDKYPEPMRILLTGYSDMGAVIDAINKGKIFHYLSKPWNEEELVNTINNAYKLYVERINEKILNEKLMRSNDQLEFLLRQKLLS
jgi:response regulator RpfG family c-di-GMP phosphodiesterase